MSHKTLYILLFDSTRCVIECIQMMSVSIAMWAHVGGDDRQLAFLEPNKAQAKVRLKTMNYSLWMWWHHSPRNRREDVSGDLPLSPCASRFEQKVNTCLSLTAFRMLLSAPLLTVGAGSWFTCHQLTAGQTPHRHHTMAQPVAKQTACISRLQPNTQSRGETARSSPPD